MIHRKNERFVVEGAFVSHAAGGKDSTVRQRVEIDLGSGLIASVGKPEGNADLRLGDDHIIFPGFIDVHVHAREDASSTQSYKETFRSAGEAAIHGGVTAFADMPNNPLPPVDDASYLAKRKLLKSCPVDVLLYAGIGPRTKPLTFRVPYKAYMGPSVGDLYFESSGALRDALTRYRGQAVSFHAESPELLFQSRDAATHSARRPAAAEARAVEDAIQFSEALQIDPHICHLSTAEGLDLVRAARRRGTRVTCEVTPHHLFYDQDNASSFSQPSFLQCNPPLRSRLDRIALLDAFRAGEIDYLATDHAPHSLEENEAGISGVPHLDTFGGFVFWLLEEGVSLEGIRLAAAERPGRFFTRYLPQPYGKVEKGFVGSLTVLTRERATVRRGSMRTKAGWSPFEGVTFAGHVSHTIVRGQVHSAPKD